MIILDMDSSVSPTHGDQQGSAYNGHFGCTCYHPLFCFNQFGDLERAMLRPGNVFSADRCMFESNFPVDMCTCNYNVLWNSFKLLAKSYSPSEKAMLFHDTATRIYRL